MENVDYVMLSEEVLSHLTGGKKKVVSKVPLDYPNSSEREYRRFIKSYIKALKSVIKKHIPQIMAEYNRALLGEQYRFDGAIFDGFKSIIKSKAKQIVVEFEKVFTKKKTKSILEWLAANCKMVNLKMWKRIIKASMGINLYDDYYSGEIYKKLIRLWVEQNLEVMQDLSNSVIDGMVDVITKGFESGKTVKALSKELQNKFKMSEKRATFIARDQMGTLNAQITKRCFNDAKVSKYIWSTSKDSRVRDCHRELEGKVCDINNPPEMWYNTKSRGRVYTGRRCNPGEDYCCRCVMYPILDVDYLKIPISANLSNIKEGQQ